MRLQIDSYHGFIFVQSRKCLPLQTWYQRALYYIYYRFGSCGNRNIERSLLFLWILHPIAAQKISIVLLLWGSHFEPAYAQGHNSKDRLERFGPSSLSYKCTVFVGTQTGARAITQTHTHTHKHTQTDRHTHIHTELYTHTHQTHVCP
jgi:hypothetical protein